MLRCFVVAVDVAASWLPHVRRAHARRDSRCAHRSTVAQVRPHQGAHHLQAQKQAVGLSPEELAEAGWAVARTMTEGGCHVKYFHLGVAKRAENTTAVTLTDIT